MEMNELFMCSAANADTDEMLLTSLLPPPLLHFDSSSSSSSPWPPPCFHDTGIDFDYVLGSFSSLSSTATANNESLITGQLFSGNVLIPRSSHFNHHHHHRPSLLTDPGFTDRAEKFSCLDRMNPPLGKYVSAPARVPAIPRMGNCDSPNCRDESSRSLEGSSISEQVPGKRKSLDRGKAKEPLKFAEGADDSVITTTKRSMEDEKVDGGDDVGPAKQPKLGNEAEGVGRKKKKKKGGGGDDVEPPKDYIHVRARRGQATDSHSLAERVRRDKISERMKMLQDLVPSCSKVTGKALMLDEIINYVQSLQRQVEFLSMKLASVNTSMHYAMNTRIILKDMFQSTNTTTITAAQLSMFEPPLHEKMHVGTNFKYSMDPPLPDSRIPPLNGLDDQILIPFRGEDLHSIVEMGLFGQTNPRDFEGSRTYEQQHEHNGGASAVENNCRTFSNSCCRDPPGVDRRRQPNFI